MKAGFVFFAVMAGIATARAHPVAQGALEIDVDAAKIELRARVSPEEVVVANMHADVPATQLTEAYKQHGDYLLHHLRVLVDGRPVSGRLTNFSLPESERGKGRAIYDFQYAPTGTPASIRVEQDVLNEFDYAPGNRWEATYVVSAREGARMLVDGALFTSSAPLILSSHSSTSGWRSAADYLVHGVRHILGGYDHLLFIAALALSVSSFWQLFRIIAAFTLAHTITLVLSVLNILRLPSQIVEPVIAASIVFVALQNVLSSGRRGEKAKLCVAFFFGLFHGLGFAGGLLDAMGSMPTVSVTIAIVSFSLGVEFGHQCVVLPLFGLTKLVRSSRVSRVVGDRKESRRGEWFLRSGSAAISLAGMFYLVTALAQSGAFLWSR